MSFSRLATLGLYLLLLALAACKQPGTISLEKTRPLPESVPGTGNFSSEPAKPYSQSSPNLFARVVFEADGPPGYRVEVRDLMIPPKKKAADVKLPGAAFLEVRYGAALLTLDGRQQQLAMGNTLAISQGQAFTVESTSNESLTIRAQIVRAQ